MRFTISRRALGALALAGAPALARAQPAWPNGPVRLIVPFGAGGAVDKTSVLCRVDTADEVEYYKNGGILHYVLRGMAKAA